MHKQNLIVDCEYIRFGEKRKIAIGKTLGLHRYYKNVYIEHIFISNTFELT